MMCLPLVRSLIRTNQTVCIIQLTTYCINVHFPPQKANYVGSLTQSSTICLGTGPDGDVYIPLKDILPMVHPNDIIFDGE